MHKLVKGLICATCAVMCFGAVVRVEAQMYVQQASSNTTIQKLALHGAYMGAFGPSLSSGQGISVGPDGNVYAAWYASNEIRKLDKNTGATLWTRTQTQPAGQVWRGSVLFSASSQGSGLGKIQSFDTSGNPGAYTLTGLNWPQGVSVGPDNLIYYTDSYGKLYTWNPGDAAGTQIASGLGSSRGMAWDGNDLYIADYNGKIWKKSGSAAPVIWLNTSGAVKPTGLVISGGQIYVSDSTSNTVKIYNLADASSAGSIGSGRLSSPTYLAVQPGYWHSVANVKDFGAVGNGVADDSSAIEAAVATLDPATGTDTLYFPSGTYKISRAIVPPSGVDVAGACGVWADSAKSNITRTGGPAIELIGNVHDISIRDLWITGGPAAAINQRDGAASHIYIERCYFITPSDGLPDPISAQDYTGRTSDAVRFTNVQDSTILFSKVGSVGRAMVAVEGTMSGLSILRCISQGDLTGFYFDTANAGPCLMLNDTVNTNKGYELTAKNIQNLTVRGLTSEGLGSTLPLSSQTGPPYDLQNATNLDLELIYTGILQSGRGNAHTTWDGPQFRLTGQNNTIAYHGLGTDSLLTNSTFDSNDPNLVVWNNTLWYPQSDPMVLNLTGAPQRRAIIDGQFTGGTYTNVIYTPSGQQQLTSASVPLSPATRTEPALWPGAAPRYSSTEMALPSVRDFGAVGDGVTDDSVAFNTAVAIGGPISVPAGTYRIAHPINIHVGKPVELLGAGKSTTTLVGDPGIEAIILYPDTGINGYTCGVDLADMTLHGGDSGIKLAGYVSDVFVRRVRFESQVTTCFRGDFIDNGNTFMDCEFVGAKYGFVAGGWLGTKRFVDKTLLWRCTFDSQSINGVLIGGVDGTVGQWYNTALRDCTIRNSGGPGVVIWSPDYCASIIDHCLIEDCNRNSTNSPYVVWSGEYAMYCTTVRRNSGQLPYTMITNNTIWGTAWARMMDVNITGAAGAIALTIPCGSAWLERVTGDGSIQLPVSSNRIVKPGSSIGPVPDIATYPGLVNIERCTFASWSPTVYELYALSGNTNNQGTSGGPADKSANFSYDLQTGGMLAGSNSTSGTAALSNMHSAIPPALDSIRIGAWIKTTDLNGTIRRLYGTTNGVTCGAELSLSNGKLSFHGTGWNRTDMIVTGGIQVNDGKWHYVSAVTMNCGSGKATGAIYVDGFRDSWYVRDAMLMTPTVVQSDYAFGFSGSMSGLEFDSVSGSGTSCYTGTGSGAVPISVDLLFDSSTTPLCSPPQMSLDQMKASPDFTCGTVTGTVTAAFADSFYIQTTDKIAGIRVYKVNNGFTANQIATVSGAILTSSNGERYIWAGSAY